MKIVRRLVSWLLKLSAVAVFSLAMMIAGVAFSGLTAIVSSIAAKAGITTALSAADETIDRQSKKIADADAKNAKLKNQVDELDTKNKKLKNQVTELGTSNKKLNQEVAELGTSNKKLNQEVAELAAKVDVKTKHVKNVDEILSRVVRRTGVGLSRELGETAVSWVPGVSTVVAGVTIAWDIKDACDTIRDIDYLIDVIEIETTNVYDDPSKQSTIKEWCGSNKLSAELLDQKRRNERKDDVGEGLLD